MPRLSALLIPLCLALGTATAGGGELADTAWRLVEIQSMDDRVEVPDDPARYTLALHPDGRAAIGADCNRGTASWTSSAPGQLAFSPVASTRMLCPPGSLSERYLAQFEWVRSYVLRDGHLYLATMADGSIIEFQPEPGAQPTPAATLFGEPLDATDPGEIRDLITTRLFDRFAADHGIAAEPGEIDAFVARLREGMAADGLSADKDMSPGDAAEVDAMQRAMGHALIRQWKINRALYGQYGGRIVYQQFGPEPIDAYRHFFEQRQAEGAFTIARPEVAATFWHYVTDDAIHVFMPPGGPDEARAFTVPPWEAAP